MAIIVLLKNHMFIFNCHLKSIFRWPLHIHKYIGFTMYYLRQWIVVYHTMFTWYSFHETQ